MSHDARPEAVLARGVRRGRIYQVVGGLALVAVSVAFIAGYEISSPTGSDAINLPGLIILFALMGMVGLLGVLFLYQSVTGGPGIESSCGCCARTRAISCASTAPG